MLNAFRYLISLCVIGILSACQPEQSTSDSALQLLAEWLTGEMDSSAQANSDQDYYAINLAASAIWPEREDGIWIYLEQAPMETIDQPYRQRIYHLHEPQLGQFVSDVYTLPDPDSVIGTWKNAHVLDEYGPEDLALRVGCSVYIQRDRVSQFSGATRGQNCSSSINDASYATSEVVINAAGINSWERGFNSNNEQVWGAEKGAYQFIRK